MLLLKQSMVCRLTVLIRVGLDVGQAHPKNYNFRCYKRAMSKIKSHSGWFTPVIPAFRKLMLERGFRLRRWEVGREHEANVGYTEILLTEKQENKNQPSTKECPKSTETRDTDR